ncbi:MAG: thermonuclease family protein [Candidatus Obscuribacterales bacterium]
MKRLTKYTIALIAFLFGFFQFAVPADTNLVLKGKVVGIADGDTITIKCGDSRLRVRLFGIDCPEKLQPFGKEATEFTASIALNRKVQVTSVDRDRYGRTVGYVQLNNGDILNYLLVSNGLAWWSRQYAPEEIQIATRELLARTRHLGLWSDPDPTPPWQFRRGETGMFKRLFGR